MEQIRPRCIKENCNNLAKKNGHRVNGDWKFYKLCSPHRKALDYAQQGRKKKGYCEKCGFKAERPCQLDIDHINGDNKNNNTMNLQTLCSNCHRLKTYIRKDWKTN